MARDDLETRVQDLERLVSTLQDQMRTFTSSPQDDVVGSKQRAFKEVFLKGSGNVSRITLGADGTSLGVEKVQ